MRQTLSTLLLVFLSGLQYTHTQGPATDTLSGKESAKHHFYVKLPGQISFNLSLNSLEDWDANDFFYTISNPVKKHIQYFEDSMNRQPAFQNILDIEKKPNADYEQLNFRQVAPAASEMVFKDGTYYQLKNSIDSLWYTSYVSGPQTRQGTAAPEEKQLLITAKSLADIGTLTMAQVQNVRQQMDSMVQAARLKANRHNSKLYSSKSGWSLSETGEQASTFSDQKPFMKIVNNFKLGVSYGAIVFNNSISPTMELNLGYILKRSRQHATFIGLNYSLFSEIDLRNRNNLVGYLPLNLEVGTIRNNAGLMQRKTSIGYGMMLKTTKESGYSTTHYLFNMQLNFAFSNTLSSSLMIASQFRRDPEHYVLGVSFKYNL
mgnify:CR=1 FL=1